MRLAWIDYELGRSPFFLMKMQERGIELFGETSFDRFRETHGNLEDYDGLTMHPTSLDLSYYLEKLLKLQDKKFPILYLSSSLNDHLDELFPVFHYGHYDAIAEFFRRRQTSH